MSNQNPTTSAPAIPTVAQLMAELQAMKAENEVLKAKKSGAAPSLSCKVSEKGAVSVYGLQRFPVTLYGNQWERLLGASDTIRAFLADHAGQLTQK